jgi:ATP-dependent helicase/nuclease subunit A
MSLTAAQQAAIAARGNVLVVAGAGAGKTRTLVERCLDCLTREAPPVGLDQLLVVTFTEAAAAEVRQRIRARLEEQTALRPAEWRERLALFDTACIGTLHSFCLQLVREHFYELELDPQLAVLPEQEAHLLAEETLDRLLQEHYAGRHSASQAVQQLIHVQGRGSDPLIRRLVLRLHHYSQTLPNPAAWLDAQSASFQEPEPVLWHKWLREGLAAWRQEWLATLTSVAPANPPAGAFAGILEQLPPNPSCSDTAAALAQVLETWANWPRGNKTEWRAALDEFLADAEFLRALTGLPGGASPLEPGANPPAPLPQPLPAPLAQDWDWVRGQMETLLDLAREFTAAFGAAKRELGMVDFHDLEQYALALLWDGNTAQPTRIAREWQRRLRFIFVDEYQDINAAQDKIIEALSRPGIEANRFLVGDVKQSIYRFRLANPHIFQGYLRLWHEGAGQIIPLVDNFRSREGLLDFVNSLFAGLMRPDFGGVAYDERAQLRFGAPAQRQALSTDALPAPCVELHLRLKSQDSTPEPGDDPTSVWAELSELEETDKEARLLGLRLRALRAGGFPVWDEAAAGFRPVRWSDMAILLRAPAAKADSFAKEFARLGIPLQVSRGGFYQNLEISDLLCLLQLLDNPLQDIPLLAVLRSPLVGLSLDELARIRLALLKAPFWTAIQHWARGGQAPRAERGDNAGPEPPEASGQAKRPEVGGRPAEQGLETFRKVSLFLERFNRWRRLARQVSLSRCLDTVLAETHYADWLLTQPRGQQRYANVERFLALAEQFDQFQRQGLFRFLRFIEAQQAAQTEPDVTLVNLEDSVRLVSIHQSKGLEFPVVAVGDLGKRFNLAELQAPLVLDEQYGLCPQIKPPNTGTRYPSLPYWLARRRQTLESLGEELRLLYVALTRARDALLLTATISPKEFEMRWLQPPLGMAAASQAARSCTHWLGPWFARHAEPKTKSGENALLRWHIHEDDSGLMVQPAAEPESPAAPAPPPAATDPLWLALQQRLAYAYPFAAATRQPAKTSVSALRRRAAPADEDTTELFQTSNLAGFHLNSDPTVPLTPAPLSPPSSDYGEANKGEGKSCAPLDGSSSHSVRARERGLLSRPSTSSARRPKLSPAQIGLAHHAFLRLVELEHTDSVAALRRQAQQLEQRGALDQAACDCLDFLRLAAFWASDLGRKLRAQAQFLQRELPFTARFPANTVAALAGQPPDPALDQEFVVVQGVADLVVLLPGDIWLLDYKTDDVDAAGVDAKTRLYSIQLKLYAQALRQIYHRPVTHCWLYFLSPGLAQEIEP